MNDVKLQQALMAYSQSGASKKDQMLGIGTRGFQSYQNQKSPMGGMGGMMGRGSGMGRGVDQSTIRKTTEQFYQRPSPVEFDEDTAKDSIVSPFKASMEELDVGRRLDEHDRHDELTDLLWDIKVNTGEKKVEDYTSLLLKEMTLNTFFSKQTVDNINALQGVTGKWTDRIKPLLFGSKKEMSIQDKILDTSKKQLEFMMTGGLDQRKGFMQLFKEGGILGGMGSLLKRGITTTMGSGVRDAQIAEERKAKGEMLTGAQKRALAWHGSDIIKRGGPRGMLGGQGATSSLIDDTKFQKREGEGFASGGMITRVDEPKSIEHKKEQERNTRSLISGFAEALRKNLAPLTTAGVAYFKNAPRAGGKTNSILESVLDGISYNADINKKSFKEQVRLRRTVIMGKIFGFLGSVVSGISTLASTITGWFTSGLGLLAVGAASAIGGMFMKGGAAAVMKKLVRFIPVIGKVVAVGAALFGAATGWMGAAETFNTEAPTLGQKISSAIGGMISGITFGLVDAEKSAKWLYEGGNSLGERIRRWVLPSPNEMPEHHGEVDVELRSVKATHGKEGVESLVASRRLVEVTRSYMDVQEQIEERALALGAADNASLAQAHSSALGGLIKAQVENRRELAELEERLSSGELTINNDEETKGAFRAMVGFLQTVANNTANIGASTPAPSSFDPNTSSLVTGH